MTPPFGSCHVLLGQAGERTPLFLSELAFRDAKYDTHSASSPTLATSSVPQPPCALNSLLWSCIPKTARLPAPPSYTGPGFKEVRPRSCSDPCQVWASTVPVCSPPALSLLLSQTRRWDLKLSEPGHTAQVTRLSAESVSALCLPPRLWWTQSYI